MASEGIAYIEYAIGVTYDRQIILSSVMQKLKEAFKCMTSFRTNCSNLDRKQNCEFRACLNYFLYHPESTFYDLAQEVHADSENVHLLTPGTPGGFGSAIT